MAEKRTVEDKIDALATTVEKGFAALASDIATIEERLDTLATKDQIATIHTQVNSIETQLRGMKHDKLETRVAGLEDKVFGAPRR